MRRASGRDSDVVVCDDVMSDDNDDVDEDMDVILDEPRSESKENSADINKPASVSDEQK